ncbi:MAG: class I SAM-dependent methyltransferase [Desulfobacterales bacterium]
MSSTFCAFCNEKRNYVYHLNGYAIYRCACCGLIGVGEPPTEKYLYEYYQGFSFQADLGKLSCVLIPEIRNWMRSFLPSIPATMLDFGGGSGFFAKAFEHFGFGESTYFDLDGSACRFASNELGVKRVLHGSVDDLLALNKDAAFDFIYCRHVIEHLTDPVKLIFKLAELLSHQGVLVIQCPNGRSKEGIAYPGYWRQFLAKVARDNQWTKPYAIAFSLTKGYGWGLSPPRHLWSITGQSIIRMFLRDQRFTCVIKTASLANAVYSPYFQSNTRLGKLRNFTCNMIFGPVLPGMHLIAEIRRR